MNLSELTEDRDGLMWPRADKGLWAAARGYEVLATATTLCKQHRVAIQAGGACGTYPLWLSRKFKHVYTWEPDSLNFLCLTFNTRACANVTRFQAGLGAHEHMAHIEAGEGNAGTGYLVPDGKIPVMVADRYEIPFVDMIQLDVEGMELSALHGLADTILAYRPVVVIEVKGHGARYGWPQTAAGDWLMERGYERSATVGKDQIYVAD